MICRAIRLLILLIPITSYGQGIDELNKAAFSQMIYRDRVDSAFHLANTAYQLAQPEFPSKVAISMVVIGRYYQLKFQLDTAKYILDRAREVLLESQYHHEAIYAITFLGMNQNLKEDTYSAKQYFEEAESLIGSNTNLYIQHHIYAGLGHAYTRRGDYPKSLEYFKKNLSISKVERDKVKSLNGISIAYSYLHDYNNAKKFAKQALSLVNKTKSLMLKVDVYEALIRSNSASGDIDSALYYTNQLIESIPKSQQHHLSGFASRKGALYFELNQYTEAIESIEEALVMKNQSSYSSNEEVDYWYLSRSYQAIGQLDKALTNARLSLKKAKEKGSMQATSTALKLISDLMYSTGQLDSSIYHLRLSSIYKDSVFNDKTQKKFADLRVEIETLEKQKLIDKLNAEKIIDHANEKVLLTGIIGVSTISVTLIIALFYRQKNRKKQQKIMELELSQSIERKELQLQQQALHMVNLNNSISEVEERLRKVKKKKVVSGEDVQKVLSSITVSKSMDKEWQQFETYFSNIHSDFKSNLTKKHPDLTRQERRLIALIKVDLSNREIANLFGIAPKSVVMNRYRLKLKLGLKDEEDLEAYIRSL